MRILLCIALAASILGCTDQANDQAARSPETAAPSAAAGSGPLVELPAVTTSPSNPDEVLVDVDGKKLLRREAELEADLRLEGVRDSVSPQRLASMRDKWISEVVDRFVMRTLLLNETEKLKISVSADDEQNAIAKIQQSLPEGVTVEDLIKQSPLGEARMREELKTGILINKLVTERLTNDVAVTEEEITGYMDANKDKLTKPESVRASHILLAVDKNADEKTRAEKKQKAEDLRKSLVEGADFSRLAKENSDCDSGKLGGDLGTFPRGQMVKAFEDAAFAQKVGEIGPVVETQFGYHIIKVTEHEDGGTISREDVARGLKEEKQLQRVKGYIDGLKKQAKIVYSKGQAPAVGADVSGKQPAEEPAPPAGSASAEAPSEASAPPPVADPSAAVEPSAEPVPQAVSTGETSQAVTR